MPGSHLSGGFPRDDVNYDEVSPEVAKGSAMVFDGRIWHGTAANESEKDRLTVLVLYTGPQFRQIANFTCSLRPDIRKQLPDRVKDVLGYRPWNGYDSTEDYDAEHATCGQMYNLE